MAYSGKNFALAVLLLPAMTGVAEVSAPLPLDSGQEEKLLGDVGQGFQLKRTAHFLVAFDTDPQVMNDLISRLEQTWRMVNVFCEMNGIKYRPPDKRLEVVFFDDPEAYARYAARLRVPSLGTAGLYVESINRSIFYNSKNDPDLIALQKALEDGQANLDGLSKMLSELPANGVQMQITFSSGRRLVGTRAQLEQQLSGEIEAARDELSSLEAKRKRYSDQINQTIIQHETAHQSLFNLGVHVRGARNPRWLAEGLACLFETPPGPPGSGLAAINYPRLRDFRAALTGDKETPRISSRLYDPAVAAGRLPSVKDLVTQPGLFAQRGDRGANNYAAAWALTYFLHREEPEALAAYLRELSQRKPNENPSADEELALFEKHFGELNEILARRMCSFIVRIPYRRLTAF